MLCMVLTSVQTRWYKLRGRCLQTVAYFNNVDANILGPLSRSGVSTTTGHHTWLRGLWLNRVWLSRHLQLRRGLFSHGIYGDCLWETSQVEQSPAHLQPWDFVVTITLAIGLCKHHRLGCTATMNTSTNWTTPSFWEHPFLEKVWTAHWLAGFHNTMHKRYSSNHGNSDWPMTSLLLGMQSMESLTR